MEKRWVFKEKGDEGAVQALASALNIDDYLSSLLVQRDIRTFDEAKTYFRPQFEDLHDPFLMKDMDKAIDRITTAVENLRDDDGGQVGPAEGGKGRRRILVMVDDESVRFEERHQKTAQIFPRRDQPDTSLTWFVRSTQNHLMARTRPTRHRHRFRSSYRQLRYTMKSPSI